MHNRWAGRGLRSGRLYVDPRSLYVAPLMAPRRASLRTSQRDAPGERRRPQQYYYHYHHYYL